MVDPGWRSGGTPFTNASGAVRVFTTRAHAENLATGDPFVRHGAGWAVREGNEVLYQPSLAAGAR